MEELYAEMEPMSDELVYQYNQELIMWELKSIEEAQIA
jgi:hypothetical protein